MIGAGGAGAPLIRALSDASEGIAQMIAEIPAHTLPGLRAKARAALIWFDGQESSNPIVRSLLNDLTGSTSFNPV